METANVDTTSKKCAGGDVKRMSAPVRVFIDVVVVVAALVTVLTNANR